MPFIFLLTIGCFSSTAWGQTEILSLIDDSQSSTKQNKRGIVPLDSIAKRLVELDKIIKAEKQKKHQATLNKRIKALQEQVLLHQALPKKREFRGNIRILALRAKIAKESKSYIEVLLKLQTIHTSQEQTREELKSALNNYRQARKKFQKYVKAKFPEVKKEKLYKVILRLKKRLSVYKLQQKKSAKGLKLLNEKMRKNQTRILKARKDMLREPEPKKKVEKKGAAKVVKKRVRRPRRLSAAEKKRLERKQERAQEIERLSEMLSRSVFYRVREVAQYLKFQKKEEKLLREVADSNMYLLHYTLTLLTELYHGYTVKAKLRLVYHDPIQFGVALFKDVGIQSAGLFTRGVAGCKHIAQVIYKKAMQFKDDAGIVILILYLLIPLFLLAFVLWFRRFSKQKSQKYLQHYAQHKQNRSFWRMLSLLLDIGRVAAVYVAFFGLFLFFDFVFDWPASWEGFLLRFGVVILSLRLLPTLVHYCFHSDPTQRLVKLNDALSLRLRKTFLSLAWLSLIGVPLLLITQALGNPKGVQAVLWLLFGFALWGFSVFFFISTRRARPATNAPDISLPPIEDIEDIDEEPSGPALPTSQGLWLARFVGIFYPLSLLCGTVVLISYASGYRNFSAYLTQAVILSIAGVTLCFAMFHIVVNILLWVFGAVEGTQGLLNSLEERRSEFIVRSLSLVLGMLFILAAFSVFAGAWRIPGGYEIMWKAVTFPVITIQKSKLSILSLLSFGGIFGASVWLSRWTRAQLSASVYPLFHLDAGIQHALNITVGYLIILLGGMGGLQAMGMSLGVLAVFAGVIGIGVGFGLKDIASNFISGLLLTFTRPFAIGDVIEVDGNKGIVKKIGMRSTTLQNGFGFEILIPNGQLVNSRVKNLSAGGDLWDGVEFSAQYGCDEEVIIKVIDEIGKEHPKVTKTFPVIAGFSSDSVNFALWIGFDAPLSGWGIKSALMRSMYKRFKELGIKISVPLQEIQFNAGTQAKMLEEFGQRGGEVEG